MRTLIALLALFALTAFAPAPFPKTQRENPRAAVSLEQLQGKWKITAFDTYGQNGEKRRSGFVWGVRIEGSLWTFLDAGDVKNTQYTLLIDNKRRPATIDFFSYRGDARQDEQPPYMLGLVRRNGDTVEILYYTTTRENRASSFDNPPAGWWLLTLKKVS